MTNSNKSQTNTTKYEPDFSQVDPGNDTGYNKRLPLVLLLDTSGSMSGRPIQELNSGLHVLPQELEKDEVASDIVEITVITFGGSVNIAEEFIKPDKYQPTSFSASGGTPMGEAILLGIQKIEERLNHYKKNQIDVFRPWLWLVTDGGPTDRQNVKLAKSELNNWKKKIHFFPIGTESANFSFLKNIAVNNPPVKLKGINFSEMFKFVSASLSTVAQSGPGDQLQIPSPSQWGEIQA